MHYVKQFKINGVDTKQVACIELKGKPNTATEGAVGLLGIDTSSPTHEVYKCVAVNGSIYTWELLSSGVSTIATTMSGEGEDNVNFPYETLKTPSGYVIKVGDLILDSKGYLYQIHSINADHCVADYCDIALTKGEPGATPYVGENGNWWIGNVDTGVRATNETRSAIGTYVGTGVCGSENKNQLSFDFVPKIVFIVGNSPHTTYGYILGILWNAWGITFQWNSDHEELSTSVTGNTIKWYSPNSVSNQMNLQDVAYTYIAFGEDGDN